MSSFHCQRVFQGPAPVNCVCLHPNQAELIVGDQSGVIHLWDLRSDHNEQLVKTYKVTLKVARKQLITHQSIIFDLIKICRYNYVLFKDTRG